jgi:hypothetical protein
MTLAMNDNSPLILLLAAFIGNFWILNGPYKQPAKRGSLRLEQEESIPGQSSFWEHFELEEGIRRDPKTWLISGN